MNIKYNINLKMRMARLLFVFFIVTEAKEKFCRNLVVNFEYFCIRSFNKLDGVF